MVTLFEMEILGQTTVWHIRISSVSASFTVVKNQSEEREESLEQIACALRSTEKENNISERLRSANLFNDLTIGEVASVTCNYYCDTRPIILNSSINDCAQLTAAPQLFLPLSPALRRCRSSLPPGHSAFFNPDLGSVER